MPTIDRRDIQGNILEGYTFPHVRHLFAYFPDATRGKRALAELAPLVTLATVWPDGVRPDVALNLGLSYAGLKALGVAEQRLSRFPLAFREGMHARARALGDVSADFEDWWQDPARVQLWIWMHGRTRDALEQLAHSVTQRLAGLATLLALAIDGEVLRNADDLPIEHFGFRDGISGPSVIGSKTPARPGDGNLAADGEWKPIATGEFLLGHTDESGAIACLADHDTLGDNGSFAVFRKLGQDVAGFRAYLKQQAALLAAIDPGIDEAWLAARMVGRQRNGVPLIRDVLAYDDTAPNAFTFGADREGRVCPLGSHIRRANPRDGHTFADAFKRHRILRRGVAFGKALADGEAAVAEPAESQFSQRGLLFVALNADLERQFEFLQRLYMNDGEAAKQGRDADPLVGSRPEDPSDFVVPGDAAQARTTMICPKLPQFVKCLGGGYFFLPALHALAELAGSRPFAVRHAGPMGPAEVAP
jgi:Dyp-type peroxidase family